MKLYIGNKNYSSWSMRPWLLMRQMAIPFEEARLRLSFEAQSEFKRRIASVSPAGRVPVLVDDDGFSVWDTLAIAETLAERFPERPLWPRAAHLRARARSLSAEMHTGFGALRDHFPMNIEARLPEIGVRMLREQPAAAADLARIDAMWGGQLDDSGGPFLFGEFGIVDAFYAPVCARIVTYNLPVSDAARAYLERVWTLPAMQAWVAEALAEHDFLVEDEPYRRHP
jgi:glutathione S-transferase